MVQWGRVGPCGHAGIARGQDGRGRPARGTARHGALPARGTAAGHCPHGALPGSQGLPPEITGMPPSERRLAGHERIH